MSEITNDNVISTVAIVLNSVMDHITLKLPGISLIYDENLGYDTGARLIRDNNNLRDEFTQSLPAIFFRRSVLRYQEEGSGRRTIVGRYLDKVTETESAIYKALAGIFDIEFIFVTTKISQLENFEISWLSESNIGSEKEIKVPIGDLGDTSYYMKLNPLDDKIVNSQGNYYKTLSGTMSVRGNYYTIVPNSTSSSGLYKHINEIHKKIYGIRGNFLEGEVIS